jgi:hypothetical protein
VGWPHAFSWTQFLVWNKFVFFSSNGGVYSDVAPCICNGCCGDFIPGVLRPVGDFLTPRFFVCRGSVNQILGMLLMEIVLEGSVDPDVEDLKFGRVSSNDNLTLGNS